MQTDVVLGQAGIDRLMGDLLDHPPPVTTSLPDVTNTEYWRMTEPEPSLKRGPLGPTVSFSRRNGLMALPV
jgi:hypothetical protein